MFARVLVQQCPFMLLDEPTSAQDPKGTLTIQRVLMRQRTEQAAVLAAVHDINLALRFFDRLIVLKQGKVISQGRPMEVLDSGALQEAFEVRLRRIGKPGTSLVISEMNSQGKSQTV